MEQVRTRMAPSPTGNLHIGTAYATMWPFVFARHNKGVFILRIEDTDLARSSVEFEQNIVEGLKWLGFDWNEGPIRVMDRLELYQKYAEQLLKENKAYYCFCTKEELDEERKRQAASKQPQVYSGKCRNLTSEEVEDKLKAGNPYVIRFKMPQNRGIIEFEDILHGKVSWDSKLIGDVVIMRQNGVPLYNFAVVVDDIEMGITDVIRGDDHLSNTPKQVVLYEALSKPTPRFAHFPMILNEDRIGKLSKRTGSTSVNEFRLEGYLPEALFNYIAYLGWGDKVGKEIFSKDELIEKFDIKQMSKSGAAWNPDKLDWMNGEYIRMMSDEELTKRLQEFLVDHPAKEKIAPLVPLVKERIKKLSDFVPLTDFIFEKPEYDLGTFQKLGVESEGVTVKDLLTKIEQVLINLSSPWTQTEFEESFRKLASELNLQAGSVFQLIRVAISGQTVTPPLLESMKILGEEESLNRIKILASRYPQV